MITDEGSRCPVAQLSILPLYYILNGTTAVLAENGPKDLLMPAFDIPARSCQHRAMLGEAESQFRLTCAASNALTGGTA